MDAWPLTLWHAHQPLLQWGVVALAALAAAGTDLRARRIPNLLTGPLFLAGVIWASYEGGWRGAADSLCGALIMSVPFILLFLFAGGGAGDAKLMGAAGAWLGIINGTAALAAVSLAGITLAVMAALAKGRGREVATNVAGILTGWMALAATRQSPGLVTEPQAQPAKSQTVPYGVAICVGILAAGIGVLVWRS